jgi:1-acyl-sn-glycerol-3-phosphate acyltransferase
MMGKRLRISGKEHLVKGRKYILLANHSSMFDITAIMAFFPGVSWFGHERLLRIPLFGKMLMMNDFIPMTLATVRNTRRMMEQLMEKSHTRTVAIFPEGTRTLDGKMNPFYRGFIYLLRATGTDILPVTLNGFFRLKPKNRFHINFGARLEVIIHPPIANEQLTNLEDKQIIEQVRSVIESVSQGE